MTAIIDPRCPWIQVHPAPDGPAWRLVDFVFENGDESGGNHNIYVNLLRADGSPANSVRVFFGWPNFEKPDDQVPQPTDAHGNTDFPMGANATINDKHPRGPYWVMPEKNKGQADMVDGMGLPNNHHVNYRLFYQWQETVVPPPPPPSENGDTWDELRAFAKTLADTGAEYTAKDGRKFVVVRGGSAIAVTEGNDLFAFFKEEL